MRFNLNSCPFLRLLPLFRSIWVSSTLHRSLYWVTNEQITEALSTDQLMTPRCESWYRWVYCSTGAFWNHWILWMQRTVTRFIHAVTCSRFLADVTFGAFRGCSLWPGVGRVKRRCLLWNQHKHITSFLVNRIHSSCENESFSPSLCHLALCSIFDVMMAAEERWPSTLMDSSPIRREQMEKGGHHNLFGLSVGAVSEWITPVTFALPSGALSPVT